MPFTGSDICKVCIYFRVLCFHRLFPCLHCLLSRSCTSRRSPFAPFYCSYSVCFYAFDRLAIFIPPLGVFLERGCHADFVCSPFSLVMQSCRKFILTVVRSSSTFSSYVFHHSEEIFLSDPDFFRLRHPVDDLRLHVCVHSYRLPYR